MIRIGILGDIGSGKSYVANNFGFPVFNADHEVSKLYSKNKKIFYKLNKQLPKYISTFPIDKDEITNAILANNSNFKKIIKIIHKEVRKKMKLFLKKNRNKKFVILDIPLLIENKINNKKDILVFIESSKTDINKRLRKRQNFNNKLFKKFKKIQFSPIYKKRKAHFVIKNKFTKKSVKVGIKNILNKIL
jgi:dephospho-CoA kinase|tara:strand:- start:67 stop:636 length:570 start_codon:yes stop_codon:yes gene_type:complete